MRPHGGSNRCLVHADTQWVNNNADEIKQYLVDLTGGGGQILEVASGVYSVVFVDGQISVLEQFKLVGPDDGSVVVSGTLDASAIASYRIRGHNIVISDVTEDHGTMTIAVNDIPTAPRPQDGQIFPSGGGRVGFTCRGSTLSLFNETGVRLVLRRRALP
ncbi:MAG: hypothetical protein EXQ79_10280 [Acidimicrobiia bacterium]|nr:hypothetical protein [Acidimicrobiia bacterium]